MKLLTLVVLGFCFSMAYSQSVYKSSADNFFRSHQWQSEKEISYKDFSLEWQDVIFSFSLPSNYSEQPQDAKGVRDGATCYKLYTASLNKQDELVVNYECDNDSDELITSFLYETLDFYYYISPQKPQGTQFIVERGYLEDCLYFILLDTEYKKCKIDEECSYKIDTITTMCRFVILVNSCQFSFSYIVDESIYDFSISDKMHVMKSIRFNKKEE